MGEFQESGPPPAPERVDERPPAARSLTVRRLSFTYMRTALREGRVADVVAAMERLSPLRRAELFVRLRPAEQKAVLYAAPPELAASILADSDSASLGRTIAELDLDRLAPVLCRIPPDNLADILLRLPKELAEGVLARLDPALGQEVRKLLAFDPDTAGGLMTTRYLSVPDVVSVGRALEILREAVGGEGPSYIYIVDAAGRLVGVAPLRKLIMANPRRPVREVMVKNVVSLKVTSRKEEIIGLFDQYHFISLPVVDEKDRLAGIVTYDDVRGLMRREEREILQGMTGVDPREPVKETFAATLGRIPWITVTILGGLACALIGGLFKRVLSEIVILGIFIPLVLALGESIGSQTTSVVLLTLAGADHEKGAFLRLVVKELAVGVLVAAFSGVVVSLASLLWHGDPRLGMFIGASIVLCVFWAALLAVLIPGTMKMLRVNPAVASGPLVLALSDISTLFVYFGGASLFLGMFR